MHAAKQHAYPAGQATPLLNESAIPPDLLPKARAWFQRRMDHYAAKHGAAWPDTREWIADYINEELREHLARKGGMA